MKRHELGFGIVELLIIITILGIIATVFLINLTSARNTALERAAQAYTVNVYRAAYAYISDNTEHALNDVYSCTDDYQFGNYRGTGSSAVVSCEVTKAADGTPIVVVESGTGRFFNLP